MSATWTPVGPLPAIVLRDLTRAELTEQAEAVIARHFSARITYHAGDGRVLREEVVTLPRPSARSMTLSEILGLTKQLHKNRKTSAVWPTNAPAAKALARHLDKVRDARAAKRRKARAAAKRKARR